MTDPIKDLDIGEPVISEVMRLAKEAAVPHHLQRADGSTAIVIHKDQKLAEQSAPDRLPAPLDRIKAHRKFHDVQSFGGYVAHYSQTDSLLVADIDAGILRAVLDYHGPAVSDESYGPQTCDHIASLVLQDSDEWKIWDAFEGEWHTQDEFMLFLEQYAKDLIRPDEASILELVQDFSVTEGVEFKSAKRLDNGDRRITYNRETQTGDLIIPKKLVLDIPLYRGEPSVTLEAHFRYRISGGALKLSYVWHRAFDVRKAAFELAVANASEASGLRAYFGEVVDPSEGRGWSR